MTVPHDTATTAGADDTRHSGVFWAGVLVAGAHLLFVGVRPEATLFELGTFVGVVLLGVAGYQLQFAWRTGKSSLEQLTGVALCFVVFVAGAWLLSWQLALWQAAVVFVALVSLLSYGLYRYQLFALGLAGGEDGR